MFKADLIIIGGGPGGYEIAAEKASEGYSVLLFERAELGGTCLNRRCIPTKCLAAAAKMLSDMKRASEFGIEIQGLNADYGSAVRRAGEVISRLRGDIAGSLASVNVIQAEASLAPGRRVRAGGEEYSAERILIATGSKPARLNIPGAELCMDSDAFLQLDKLPDSAAIIGGGVIGLEFASILAAYGCEVTVIEYCKEIQPNFDSEIAKRLRSLLSRRGVKFILGAAVKSVEEGFSVEYENKRGINRLENIGAVICCVGRRPVVPDGCDSAGIDLDSRGFISVDCNMATTAEGIYAVGDVNGRAMLAHAATAQARVALGENVNLDIIPSVVFTDPECASVGLSEDDCEKAGKDFRKVKALYSSNGKAEASGESDGMVKVIYDNASRKLLGCSSVGAHAADLIAEAAIALTAGMTVDDIGSLTVHAHPTLSELLASACRNAGC